ncbi:hypothetical protein M8C21_027288, partial [Ambrosia artemisiifolia]
MAVVPRPKSPPELYGKRRESAKVDMLEREIAYLQEELKSIENLRPASSCIKEVADYVVTTPEPLITIWYLSVYIYFLFTPKPKPKPDAGEVLHLVVSGSGFYVENRASTCHVFAATAAAAASMVVVLFKCHTAAAAAPYPGAVVHGQYQSALADLSLQAALHHHHAHVAPTATLAAAGANFVGQSNAHAHVHAQAHVGQL